MMRQSLAGGILLLAACDERTRPLPSSGGGQDEVLVVMSKGHWDSPTGAAVRAILEQPILGLPQPERMFRVAQCQPKDFSSLLAVHHSVLYCDIGADTSAFEARRDVHARGQLLLRLAYPNAEAWLEGWKEESHDAVRALELHQRARIAGRLRKERDGALVGQLKSRFALTLDVPAGYQVRQLNDRFAWLQRDRIVSGTGLEHHVIEGVLIHAHAYFSDSTWSVPFLVDQRDSVTKAFVPGSAPGSYMVVQRAFEEMNLMPIGNAVQLDGRFAYSMHGLFGMHGAKMGGPFVSLSTLDPSGSRVITVEGFVYAPQFDKRAYVREIEALLYSLRFEAAEHSGAQ
jgi:hypothetical protein